MPQHLRISISSPGDVPDERLRADLIIDKLAQDYSRFFTIAAYRWEHEPMLASGWPARSSRFRRNEFAAIGGVGRRRAAI